MLVKLSFRANKNGKVINTKSFKAVINLAFSCASSFTSKAVEGAVVFI